MLSAESAPPLTRVWRRHHMRRALIARGLLAVLALTHADDAVHPTLTPPKQQPPTGVVQQPPAANAGANLGVAAAQKQQPVPIPRPTVPAARATPAAAATPAATPVAPAAVATPVAEVPAADASSAATAAVAAAATAAATAAAGEILGRSSEPALVREAGSLKQDAVQRGAAAGAAANLAAKAEAGKPTKPVPIPMTVEQKHEQLAMRTAREEKGKPASEEARKQEIKRTQEALKQAARADAARSKKQPVRRRGEDDEDDEAEEEDGGGRAGRQAIPGQAGERAIERKRAHDAAKEARKEAMFAADAEQAVPPTGGGKVDDNPLCPSWATSGRTVEAPSSWCRMVPQLAAPPSPGRPGRTASGLGRSTPSGGAPQPPRPPVAASGAACGGALRLLKVAHAPASNALHLATRSGECIRNPQFMWAVCAASCSGLSYAAPDCPPTLAPNPTLTPDPALALAPHPHPRTPPSPSHPALTLAPRPDSRTPLCSYIDSDDSCTGWAEEGECEKNPEFMLVTCNASCVRSVRRGGAEHGGTHVNPNRLGDAVRGERAGGVRAHRARTFLPIFLCIALLLAAVAALQLIYAKQLNAKQEAAADAWARKALVWQRKLPWLAPIIGGLGVDALARCMICIYFLNEGLTVMQTNPQLASLLSATHLFNGDGVWQEHVAWVDTANLLGACAALLAICNYKLLPCAGRTPNRRNPWCSRGRSPSHPSLRPCLRPQVRWAHAGGHGGRLVHSRDAHRVAVALRPWALHQ